MPCTKLSSHIAMLCKFHYNGVIMGAMASQITSLTIVYSTVYSGADQRKHESFASLAFVWGIHRWPVNSSHKWPVTRKMISFDDVIISTGFVDIGKGWESGITYVPWDPASRRGTWWPKSWYQMKEQHLDYMFIIENNVILWDISMIPFARRFRQNGQFLA